MPDAREYTAEEKLEAVHALRLKTAEATKAAQETADIVGRGPGGREVALAITKLQEAKMWGGKALGELGQKPPEGYAHDEPVA